MDQNLLFDTLAIEYMKHRDISTLSPEQFAEEFKKARESIKNVLEIPVGCKDMYSP